MSLLQSFSRLTIQSRTYVSVRSLHHKHFTSILEGVPVKPRNAWQIYLRENMKNHKNAEGKIDIRVVTKELSAVWKTLGDAEKQAYQRTYEAEYKDHMEKFEKAINNATPKQFRLENNMRKKYNLSLLKDPKQPKRPKNSFLFYLEHLRTIRDPAILGDPRSQVSEAAKKYKQLSESELKVYTDKAKAAKDAYQLEVSKYKRLADEASA